MLSDALPNIKLQKKDQSNFISTEFKTIFETFANYDLWLYIAWSDIKARYRRTVIGPFWLVIANAVTIIGMAIVWSLIFKIDIREYFPRLTASMICWTFISYSITEATTTFTQHYSIISNLPVSIYIFPLRIIMRNLITFLHNFVIFLFVILFFKTDINVNCFLFIPMFCLILINFFFISLYLGLISARFRDIQQIITTIMSVLILVTPVMWDVNMLGDHQLLANINPFTHILNVIKFPLLGTLPSQFSTIFIVLFTIANLLTMLFMLKKYKCRLAFWV